MVKLLCLSNGHGEDAIAIRILHELQQLPNCPELAALPLVGEGQAYQQLESVPIPERKPISIVGPVQKMPSGGFIYMDGGQLWRDVKGGLIQLTLAQFKVVRAWGQEGGVILAVGDIFPLLLAWLSCAPYVFVATAKSEYWRRDEHGMLPLSQNWWQKWVGSVYFPWERWLMTRSRCRGVFPRDSLTAENLQQFGIRAFDLGNPMMDDLLLTTQAPRFYSINHDVKALQRPLVIVLLPGSRSPETYGNWDLICQALGELMITFSDRQLLFLGAISSHLSLEPFCETLEAYGWRQDGRKTPRRQSSILREPVTDPTTRYQNQEDRLLELSKLPIKFNQRKSTVILTQQRFNDCLHEADLAIAMAGTATEQFVGLGKPAIAIPGRGPQFTQTFAEMQNRLLGISLILVKEPREVASVIKDLLNNPDRLQLIAENGKKRMGEPGAAKRIAMQIKHDLFS